ncbi:MAG: hypothetical protein ACRCVT_15735 [Leadbetterella sp.]
MMNFLKIIDNVCYIFRVGERYYFQKDQKLFTENFESSIDFNLLDSFIKRDYFYTKQNDDFVIYNLDLLQVNTFSFLDFNGVVDIFNENKFVFATLENDKLFYNFFEGNKIVKSQEILYGTILNENYRLNFPTGIFITPNTFTCSDLLGEVTYWEYTCEEGLEASHPWIVRGEYLVFCVRRSLEAAGKLIKIHLNTGEIKWEIDLPNTYLHYNESQGLLIAFWAAHEIGNHYQIVDIDNEIVEIGDFISSYKLESVDTIGGMQFLQGPKLYFADNVLSFVGEIRPVKFGCFDIGTKQIDFLQEIPLEGGNQIAQIMHHENKLYIRMSENNLLIYEDLK